MGNSWLSKLWDRTVGSLGKKIAINWDHGRNDVIMAAAIVVSCFVGFEVAAAVYDADSVVVLDSITIVDGSCSFGKRAEGQKSWRRAGTPGAGFTRADRDGDRRWPWYSSGDNSRAAKPAAAI